MATSGNLIVAQTIVQLTDGIPEYLTTYTLKKPAPNGNTNGGIVTPVVGITESAFNLMVQQAVADKANAESENTEDFTSADVFGGRI